MAKTEKEKLDEIMLDMASGASKDTQGVVDNGELNAEVEEVEEVEEVVEGNTGSTENKALETSEAGSAEPDKTSDEVSDEGDEWWKVLETEASLPDTSNKEEFDFVSLSKEIGIEAKSKEDLISEYKKLKEIAIKQEEVKNLPQDIVQAIEMSKKGEDYSILFKQNVGIDHKAFDDRTLLMNQNAKYFTDPTGKVDTEALTEYIDDMSERQQMIEASKIRENIDLYNQKLREDAVKAEYERKQSIQRELQNAINQANEIKGFKLTPQHKSDMMNSISSGNAMKEMFYKEDGKSYDMSKIMEVYFIYKNFDKIKTFLSRRVKDEVRKEDFKKISNSNVGVRQQNPNVKTAPVNYLDDYIRKLEAEAAKSVQQIK